MRHGRKVTGHPFFYDTIGSGTAITRPSADTIQVTSCSTEHNCPPIVEPYTTTLKFIHTDQVPAKSYTQGVFGIQDLSELDKGDWSIADGSTSAWFFSVLNQ